MLRIAKQSLQTVNATLKVNFRQRRFEGRKTPHTPYRPILALNLYARLCTGPGPLGRGAAVHGREAGARWWAQSEAVVGGGGRW